MYILIKCNRAPPVAPSASNNHIVADSPLNRHTAIRNTSSTCIATNMRPCRARCNLKDATDHLEENVQNERVHSVAQAAFKELAPMEEPEHWNEPRDNTQSAYNEHHQHGASRVGGSVAVTPVRLRYRMRDVHTSWPRRCG